MIIVVLGLTKSQQYLLYKQIGLLLMMDKSSNINLDIYLGQVSGKQPKLLSQDHTKLLKGFNKQQNQFYKYIHSHHISHPFASIQQHIPTYYGLLSLHSQPAINIKGQTQKNSIAWLNHLAARYKVRNQENKFIVLENLTYGWELPNIFDVKIGGRNVQGKKHKITKSVLNFLLRLNGSKMNFVSEKVESIFLSKYYLSQQTEMSNILQFFGLFFFDGREILYQTINSLIERLKMLILSFKSLRGLKFISSSLCILYDSKHPQKSDIKFLDFGRVIYMSPDFIDHQCLVGMQNILNIFVKVIQIGEPFNNRLKQLRKYYCETNIKVVPDRKIKEYEKKAELQKNTD